MGTLPASQHPTSSQTYIVTGLLIRRQFYRKIAVKTLGRLLRETFAGLRWLKHEGWHNVKPQKQLRFEEGMWKPNSFPNIIYGSCVTIYYAILLRKLPQTLEKLCVFEDFDDIFHPERSEKLANPSLGKAFSKSTRSIQLLQVFSAAFIIDAKHFFADFWLTKPHNPNAVVWENLRHLAVTSRLLHPKIRRGLINELLVAAGRAAAFMPKLELMEIWNGGEGHACIFRYQRIDAGEPRISWLSNWGIDRELDPDVVSCWAHLPGHGHPFTTAVKKFPFTRKEAKTHGRPIRYLKLRRDVLDQTSYYEVCWEDFKAGRRPR